ncbi:MAG: 4-(cytidine 5'-diphospho)-2-C-methyl-D-erythritol kinase [Gammaproteobacteria bacterium]|nr:4-(cytidine 5'-diphospho)-2-C-methyl-D-erythritol kinase [Gammaproteobacteria bacterium]|tara:strand:- start:65 stop:886 length:822 start_codon:yes stop_codon:yes gene_type:complete
MFHFKSPAKLNLFLNILDKRTDGYYNIQSIFQLIDFYDEINLEKRDDNEIILSSNKKQLERDNLILEAISLFKSAYQIKNFGANINLVKNIPIGSGLGGGSSNAATILLALLRIFNIDESRNNLTKLALKIGSDVPFFLQRQSAWVEGRGEKILPVVLNDNWYLLIFCDNNISTREMYGLIKNQNKPKKKTMEDFLSGETNNIFESMVVKRYPTVSRVRDWLSQYGQARMSGTGDTWFLSFDNLERAKEVGNLVPNHFKHVIVRGLSSYEFRE